MRNAKFAARKRREEDENVKKLLFMTSLIAKVSFMNFAAVALLLSTSNCRRALIIPFSFVGVVRRLSLF